MLHKYSSSDSEILAFDVIKSEIAKKNFSHLVRTSFVLKDLMSDLSDLGDLILFIAKKFYITLKTLRLVLKIL